MLTRFLLYGFLGWGVEVFGSAIEGPVIPVELPALRHGRLPVRAAARRSALSALGGAWNDLRRSHLVSRIRRRVDFEAKCGRLPLGLHDLPSSSEGIDKLGLSSYLVRLRLHSRIYAR